MNERSTEVNGHATGTNLLQVPTIFLRPIYQGEFSRNIPTNIYNYGLKNGTNVPPLMRAMKPPGRPGDLGDVSDQPLG
jgi:hypothetical protein